MALLTIETEPGAKAADIEEFEEIADKLHLEFAHIAVSKENSATGVLITVHLNNEEFEATVKGLRSIPSYIWDMMS